MTIEWRGEGCFEIATTGGHFSLITELPNRESGLSAPRTKVDMQLSIWGDLEDTLFSNEKDERFLISGPGEYELKDGFVSGLKIGKKEESLIKTAYLIKLEEISVGYLGEISKKEISPDVMGFFEGVDILLVPIGGNEMLDAESAVEIINQIEPKIVIPMYYKIPNLKRKADTLEQFLKEMGVNVKPEDKLLIKKRDLSFEETKIVPLMPV
jgi:hypothetical protein